MNTTPDVSRVSTALNLSTSILWLKDTLDSYEVAELDGLDLARLLSQTSIDTQGHGTP